jgi:hypothetical protein
MLQQDWLELRNLLKDFYTLVEHFHDLGDNLLRVGGVGWDQISLLQDEIKIKEGFWILVLIVERMEPNHGALVFVLIFQWKINVWSWLVVTVINGKSCLFFEGVLDLSG